MTVSAPMRPRSAETRPPPRGTLRGPSPRILGASILLSAGALFAVTSPSLAADPTDSLLDGLTKTLHAGSQATAPLVDDLSESLAPTIDDIATLGGPSIVELATTVTPVVEAAAPVLDLTQPVVATLAPVTEAARPLTASLSPTLQALEPVTSAARPLTQPLLAALGPVTTSLAPIIDPLSPILDQLGEAVPAAPAGADTVQPPVIVSSPTFPHVARILGAVPNAPTSDTPHASASVSHGSRMPRAEASLHPAKDDVAAHAPRPVEGTTTAAAPVVPTGGPSALLGSIEASLTAAGTGSMLAAALTSGMWLIRSPAWRTRSGASFAMRPSRTLAVPVPPG